MYSAVPVEKNYEKRGLFPIFSWILLVDAWIFYYNRYAVRCFLADLETVYIF